ncbi:MAG: hypothetical protein ABR577_02225 [Pyrinomonadaceae bacterium]
MHERQKISESEYFYSRMKVEVNDPEAFKFNLSAFLSAARSVLQYALEEAKIMRGGEAWYSGQVNSSKVAKFFKDRRDINIHQKPIALSQSITIEEVLRVSESGSITKIDEQDSVTTENFPPTTSFLAEDSQDGNSTKFSYSFPEWPSTNDALSLCDIYLSELKAIVQNGINNKFLTP